MPEGRGGIGMRNAEREMEQKMLDFGCWMLDFHRVKEFGIADWRSAEFFTMGVVSFAKG
jgi:hypothetical protein